MNTVLCCIYKCKLQPYHAKQNAISKIPQKAADISGHMHIWDTLRRSGKVCCGLTRSYFIFGPKRKRVIHIVTSASLKASIFDGMMGMSVPMAWLTCTSVKAVLMLKGLGATSRRLLSVFPSSLQQDNAKWHSTHVTVALLHKRVWVLNRSSCSPDLHLKLFGTFLSAKYSNGDHRLLSNWSCISSNN